MSFTQHADQRVLEFLAAAAAGAFGKQFRPFAAQVAQSGSRAVEPVRINGLVAALACQICGSNLRADLGDIVVEVDQAALVIRQAGGDHGHRGRVLQVSHGNILRGVWALPRRSKARSSAVHQLFLFQGAEAILGGAAAACVVGGAAGVAAGLAATAGVPLPSGGR